jgi:serine/threonine protein kinase
VPSFFLFLELVLLSVVPRLQWSAPEVCAGTAVDSTPATTASDVYMVGSLAYELLTGGTPPFHWLATDLQSQLLLGRRRASATGFRVPGFPMPISGLMGKSVLEVAEDDGEPIPWCVRAEGTPGGPGRLAELKALLEQCLAAEPEVRPKLPALLAAFRDLLVREEAEERAAGIGGGGGGGSLSTPASAGPVSSVLPPPLPVSTASPSSATAGHASPAGACPWPFVGVPWRFVVAVCMTPDE